MKALILEMLERPVAGWPLRALGSMTRGQSRVLGLTNPFYLPSLVVDMSGSGCVTSPHSYLVERNRRNAVRMDPDSFEPEISYLIDRLVKPDHIVLDIGANMGAHTVTLARAAHRGHVYAFEPVPEMAAQLSQNCAINGLDNVTLVPCGLGDENGALEMNVNIAGPKMEGTSSLKRTVHIEQHPEWYETRSVEICRLDDVVKRLKPEGRIGFIKIDTEGFETYVLEGGKELLRENRPVLIVEAHSRRLEAAGKDFGWYLDTFPDYHIFIIHPIARANPYFCLEPLRMPQPEIALNLLLVPRIEALA